MKPAPSSPPLRLSAIVLAAAGLTISGCAGLGGSGNSGTFASVQPVLERHCVHCHGAGRLPHMVSFSDTAALAALKGPGKWIQPGRPDDSRFYQVVAAPDSNPLAMPPTGHAISKSDAASIKAWIAAGAPMPAGPPVPLTPRGDLSRSR